MSHRSQLSLVLLVLLVAGVLPATAQGGGRFPSDDPDPRVGTPDDPEFDCSEPDDEDDVDPCPSIYDEQYGLFGFAPASTQLTARYRTGPDAGQPMVSGVSADLAWKTTTGDPLVTIAILDTGVRWGDERIRTKIWLNAAELPRPQGSGTHDADGDGVVTVDDWADDSRVADANDNGLLDGQDLIRAFSDGVDDDANGYVDDIAGWDFFDDDNDPSDDSSYSAAGGHGTGRAREAAEQTDDGIASAGVCPECRVMMLREWDSFVVPGDNYAAATVYAADNDALVQVVANGVLTNSASAREAASYAADRGMALMHVSSDLNTSNHNYPTNYRESIFINGCVPDTVGLGTEIPGLQPIVDGLGVIDSQVPPTTFFRQSNLTQHGEHAAVCFMAVTGSEATGQAGGAAGLLHSRAIEVFGEPLTSDEVKQLLTMTAEDVLAANTLGIGTADPAQEGFDVHFGYGRADLAAAVARVAAGQVPPEAWIDDPAWWTLVDPVATPTLEVAGHVAADRADGWTAELQWAPGNEPAEGDFTTVATLDGDAAHDGVLGTIDMADVAAATPGSADGTPPASPTDRLFTVRLVATDADGNRGEDRKAYFAHHDPSTHEGWPRFTDTGGETSLVFADLDGDGTQEVIDADSSGWLTVTSHTGQPHARFNGGRPFQLPPAFYHHPEVPAFASGAVPAVTSGWRTPAVADLDGDLSPDIVATTWDGRLYAIDARGRVLDGFPVSVDPDLSADPTEADHRKRGFLAAPTIADLDGDGAREVVAAALDGHLYAWQADGTPRDGFPVRLADPDEPEFSGGELIATPAVGDVDGDGDLEIVSGSSEVYGATTGAPGGIEEAVTGLVTNLVAGLAGGSTRLYVVEDDGTFADGWPVAVNAILPDILPLVGPQHVPALADVDGDGDDEIAYSVTAGDLSLYDGDGSVIRSYSDELPASAVPPARPEGATLPVTLNLVEYPSIGDLDGDGGHDIVKGGVGATQAVNLVLTGQNLPYEHLVQAWSMDAAPYRPGFPAAIDDYQLLSAPAIADVDGEAGAEVLATSGLYLLRAYDASGAEVAGFPKLTGGWTIGTPAVGDPDGDGLVEIAVGTREGWRLMWDTDTPAEQLDWTTESHDACHTANAGTDCTPPARVTDLSLEDGAVTWTPTGDDGRLGEAATYEVRAADRPIRTFADWQAADVVATDVAAGDAGAGVAVPADVAHVAVVARDDAGNASTIAATGVAEVTRLAGDDRIETAVAVSQATYESADTVVIARADVYADALAGAPLAVREEAPLLLSHPDVLPAATASELDRLGAGTAVLLGGEAALSGEVADDLTARGITVERVAGPTRFHTAAAIAEAFDPAGEALLVEGIHADPARGWPDALAASALGGIADVPILLTAADALPDVTAEALTGRAAVTIIGGEVAVAPAVADAAGDAAGVSPTRIAGLTRFETARAVAEEALDRGATPEAVWLATGAAFPDGLVAGAAAAATDGVLLLVDPISLPPEAPAAAFRAAHADEVARVLVAGGTAAVSDAVLEAATAILGGG
ncbi:cell wall-binding repeat-containing protein [Euzebya sp.]|uniref:cell wall-binding repeat-containing protein n=1 Tax=Euzebya sp. TaxID=1971409 RepID=UPI00351341B6